ncbi:hypothetical protein QUB05_22445 [Microcoleus sp. F10-C6]|uniref:hypothetical protein n=1 Tax=unclassified Microcoleus TaxID=2642155 RepID=UPI002FD2C5F4
MVLKISPIAKTKDYPFNLWDGRPARPLSLVWDGRLARKRVFSQPPTHSPAFCQSHAAVGPDRP